MSELTLTDPEVSALREFKSFMMTPNRMLCFNGPGLERHQAALESLADRELLSREKMSGAYSLTQAGYREMVRG